MIIYLKYDRQRDGEFVYHSGYNCIGGKKMFSFNHVTISANNLEKTLEFYKIFGFELHKEYHDESVDIVMLKLKEDDIC